MEDAHAERQFETTHRLIWWLI